MNAPTGRATKPTKKIAYACIVPINGSDCGKWSFAKTSPVTVLQRRKSYHSIVVPIVLAITARRNCLRWSMSERALVAIWAVVMAFPPASGD